MIDWEKNSFNDMGWLNASDTWCGRSCPIRKARWRTKLNRPISSRAPLASALNQAVVTDPRFEVDPEFVVQQVLSPEETGSLIAMEINEFGHLLLSREGGPLLIADPSQPLNHPARIRVYCNEVTSCQGILPLNGEVFVTGEGPEGLGLYRLDRRQPRRSPRSESETGGIHRPVGRARSTWIATWTGRNAVCRDWKRKSI